MNISANVRASSLLTCILTVLLLCCGLPAQERCSAEVKVLLSPSQAQKAVAALGASGETTTGIYLFDTPKLELLAQGVIVRLRQGKSNDLMVKLRPPAGRQFSNPSFTGEKYKCEVDISGAKQQRSYSIAVPFTGEPPANGAELFRRLSPGQKKMLEEAGTTIDWKRVVVIEKIQSTGWEVRNQPDFGKLSLELWKYSGGELLELSGKVAMQQSSEAEAQLQQLAKHNGLSLSDTQKFKTSLTLESIGEQ